MPPYLLTPDTTVYRLVDAEGNTTEKAYRRHNFHGTHTSQRYERLAEVMPLPRVRCRKDARICWMRVKCGARRAPSCKKTRSISWIAK